MRCVFYYDFFLIIEVYLIKELLPKYRQMEEIVFSYPRLKERLSLGKDAELKRAKRLLKEIHADVSIPFAHSLVKLLDAILDILYDGIDFHFKKEIDFPVFASENHVVLVPNHQSHADYISLNYIVFKKYKIPIYVAGGINLNIFGIGTLFRKCGCFFIRRSFANDVLYKTILEAYLYYLLHEGKTIEFFFEGGRSRNGKLLSPRFGLYQMLLEAHRFLPDGKKKKLIFLPVSILHEFVPEQRALAKELQGGKKQKESLGQLLKILKIFSYQMGTVHLSVGEPVDLDSLEPKDDLKKLTQHLAFDCFRVVGKNMMITPSSLLAMIMLDDPVGAMKWDEIVGRARRILHYCDTFKIPYTDSLKEEILDESLGHALDIFIGNKKIHVIGATHLGHVFYSIKRECRLELLYAKNTILHHFLAPWMVNLGWINIFNGNITERQQLDRFFFEERNHLMFEFYLPTNRELALMNLAAVSHAVGRPLTDFNECLNLPLKDFYAIIAQLGIFSRLCSYVVEGYYLTALAIGSLTVGGEAFNLDGFFKKATDIFESEMDVGRLIRYQESHCLDLYKRALQFFEHNKVTECIDGRYKLTDPRKLDQFIKRFSDNLSEQLTFNVRVL